jgi:hypothetical protein
MADIRTVGKYIKLWTKKKKIEKDLEKTKKDINDLEPDIVDYFTRHGIQAQNADGHCAYLYSQVWASLKDREAGVKVLESSGFGWLAEKKVNSQRLSGWVRELLKEVETDKMYSRDETVDSSDLLSSLPLPDEVKEAINLTEKISVRVKKSS